MISTLRGIFVSLVVMLGTILAVSLVTNWTPEKVTSQPLKTFSGRSEIRGRQTTTMTLAKSTVEDENEEHTCTPHKDLVLLKTHKTGGSTLQNIVYRFGDSHNLTFALPATENYFGNPRVFSRSSVMKLPNIKSYNMLANHARYSKAGFQTLMPSDTMYITIIRHPATQFESMYQYYKLSSRFRVSISKFATNPSKFYNNSNFRFHQSGVNPMLFDLGLKRKHLQDQRKIKRKVAEIDANFDLVLISEYFDESLVIMKDMLCWRLEDVAYFVSNARKDEKVITLSQETKENLTTWNAGDVLLYQHFNRTLWKKIAGYGYGKLQSEIVELRSIIERYKRICLNGSSGYYKRSAKTLVMYYKSKPMRRSSPNHNLCRSLTRRPLEYLSRLRNKMRHSHHLRH